MNMRMLPGIVVGGLIGFAMGASVYLLLEPVLEDASGWIRETQGLLWNLVPLLTIAGAWIGAVLVDRMTSRHP